MERQVRLRWMARAWAMVIAALAAGCGGGGTAPSTGDVPPTMAQGAEPGQLVSLAATLETSDPEQVRYRWHQVGGAPVELRGDSSAVVQFVMPRLAVREQLDFVVEVQSAAGDVRRELHGVLSTGPRTRPPRCAAVPPDFAVFMAFKDLPDRGDLYLTRLDGSDLFRLNGPLLPGTGMGGPLISPDRRYVAYFAAENERAWNLHVARTDGGGEVQVSSVPPGNAGAQYYAWAPDSSRIAYLAAEEGGPLSPRELYTVRPDGSGKFKASGPLVAGGMIWDFAWAPDGSRLAYAADQYTAGQIELFTVRPDGTEDVRVSGPIVPGGSMGFTEGVDWSWAPDSSRLAYLATQFDPSIRELFTSRPDGSENVRASGAPVPGRGVWSYQWAPDATRIAYVANQLDPGKLELFSSRPDGTENTQISGPVDTNVGRFAWSPDAAWIAYDVEYSMLGLFVTGPDGSSYHPVSNPADGGAALAGWSPDSSRIAFFAAPIPDGSFQLFTVRPDGTGEAQVSGPVGSQAVNVADAAWDPTSSRIAFRAGTLVHGPTYDYWGRNRLYTSAADGTQRVALSPALEFTDVTGFGWTSDGRRLVYRADQYVDEQFELFVAGPTGDTVNARISGPLVEGGDVFTFLVP